MKQSNLLCPICGEPDLSLITSKEFQEYKGKRQAIDFHYAQCSCCGSETNTETQLRLNKRAMIAFQKSVDGLLSGPEIKEIRENLGLTIKQAGEIIGGGPVAFSKYENDDLLHSIPMDSALRLIQLNPYSICHLAEARGVKLVNSRFSRKASSHIVELDNSLQYKTEPVNSTNEAHTILVDVSHLSAPNVYKVYSNV
ncbi:type II toxin-antitoxin system MqsA family antitoxin [Serratia sp. S1B]|nr:type II toxin-antitoxin system MqsA family antitoxin [Serratia sp. S1B]